MKYRILDLHNDYWVRLIVVPFLGFCVPYFTELTPDGAGESFIYNHPSVFTVFLVVIVFELNRFVVKNHKNIFVVNASLIYKVILKFAFQLVFTFCLLFLFLSIWYCLFLDYKEHFDFLINNVAFGLFVTLFFLMSYELSYFFFLYGPKSKPKQKI